MLSAVQGDWVYPLPLSSAQQLLPSQTDEIFFALTAKLFHPQESDEDFASRSDNDQNQVKLMYLNEFL